MIGKKCPECGKRMGENERFCSRCGHEFYDVEEDRDTEHPVPDVRIGDYLTDDIRLCVGKQADVYIDKFTKLEYGKPKRSFNWCAALFGANWSGYRLMPGGTLIFIGINLAVRYIGGMGMIIAAFLSRSAGFIVLVTILLIVCSTAFNGYLGDWLYWRHIKRKLNQCGCRNRPAFLNDYKNARLRENGGSSTGGICAAIIVNDIVVFLVGKFFLAIINAL